MGFFKSKKKTMVVSYSSNFISIWNLVDVALIFGLSFGIYKKNIICAVIMLAYFVCSKIFIMFISQNLIQSISGIPLSLVFIYFFFEGVRGIFTYFDLEESEDSDTNISI